MTSRNSNNNNKHNKRLTNKIFKLMYVHNTQTPIAKDIRATESLN